MDLTAYRIVQEALTNTVRHSAASQATVTLSREPGYLTVSVTEAGRVPAVRVPVGVGAVAGRPAG